MFAASAFAPRVISRTTIHVGDNEDVEQSERESDGESVVREGTPPLSLS